MMAQLRANDYEVEHESKKDDAGIVVVNTCGFIEALKEHRHHCRWAQAKEEGQVERVYVTGCLSSATRTNWPRAFRKWTRFGTRELRGC